jgi:cell shape-determining protein MreC
MSNIKTVGFLCDGKIFNTVYERDVYLELKAEKNKQTSKDNLLQKLLDLDAEQNRLNESLLEKTYLALQKIAKR